MLTDLSHIVLLTLKIAASDDIIFARQRARQIAALLNFDQQNQTKIATVVSEIARNVYQYAETGKVEYCLTKDLRTPSFVVKISDKGPGIVNVDEILSGQYAAKVEGCLGIIGSKRIMDRFTIHSSPGNGTEVIAEMNLSKTMPNITPELIAKITLELARDKPKSVSEEVQQQNQELLQALALLTKARNDLEERVEERTAQLAIANAELKQEILERKRMEEWVQQHQQDLARVERINSMGEIASALAHELNQPLAAVTLYTQGCVRRLKGDDYKIDELLKAMQLAAQQAKRAGKIIHRMKNFARQGKLSLEKADINKLIKETIISMEHELEKQHVIIELKLTDNLASLMLDTIQIQQAMTNLIRNAIQALNAAAIKAPKITIHTERITQNIQINIIDNGPGFNIDNPQILLEPYFTTKKSGMGIGLAISRTIIEAHGGKLIAKNNPQGGAWFQMILTVKGSK